MKEPSHVITHTEKDSVGMKTIEDLVSYTIEGLLKLLEQSQELDSETHENAFISYLSKIEIARRPIELIAFDFQRIEGHFPTYLKNEGNTGGVEYYCKVITSRRSKHDLQQISELFPENSAVRVHLHMMSEKYN